MLDKAQLLWLFFKTSGRLNRAAYFLSGMLIAIVQAFPLYRFTLVPEGTAESDAWASAFMVVVVVTFWPNVALAVKRLHDFGKPGLAAVALFIPFVQFVAFLVLCLFPGDRGPNRYGQATNMPG